MLKRNKPSIFTRIRKRLAKGNVQRAEQRAQFIKLVRIKELVAKIFRELNNWHSRVEKWPSISPETDSRKKQVNRYSFLTRRLTAISSEARYLVESTLPGRHVLKAKIEEGSSENRGVFVNQLEELMDIEIISQKIASDIAKLSRKLLEDIQNPQSNLGTDTARQIKEKLSTILSDLQYISGWYVPYLKEIQGNLKRSGTSLPALLLNTVRKLRRLRKKFHN